VRCARWEGTRTAVEWLEAVHGRGTGNGGPGRPESRGAGLCEAAAPQSACSGEARSKKARVKTVRTARTCLLRLAAPPTGSFLHMPAAPHGVHLPHPCLSSTPPPLNTRPSWGTWPATRCAAQSRLSGLVCLCLGGGGVTDAHCACHVVAGGMTTARGRAPAPCPAGPAARRISTTAAACDLHNTHGRAALNCVMTSS
jgi:hypothetical protein